MELVNPCCCCLLRPLDRALKTPYNRFGITEIYSDMLEECFQIHLTLGHDYECGICEECVGRLRDARDFKLQVQRSQVELQAGLERAQLVRAGDVPVKLEMSDESEDDFMIQAPVKWEMSDDAISEGESVSSGVECAAPLETRRVSARAREQLAMACSVRLERLRARAGPGTAGSPPRLVRHERVGAELKTERKEEPELTSGVGAGAETYTCDPCGEQFARKSDIVRHLMKHGENKVNSKPVREKHSLVNHKRSHSDDKPDSFGSKKFSQRFLTQHKHTSDKSYTCDICNKQFTRKSTLTAHIRVHIGLKPYCCDVCSKEFNKKVALTIHTRIHTGLKPDSHENCSEKFNLKSSLTEHKRTQCNTPYSCDICDKKFTHKSHLIKHTKIHTEIKPYSCEVCSHKFLHKLTLTVHKRIHMGTKPCFCDICDKQFTRKSHLSRHMEIHTGKKHHSCNVCFKKFSQTVDFMRHKRIHNTQGDKSYSCNICNKQFTRKFNLTKHVAIHYEPRAVK